MDVDLVDVYIVNNCMWMILDEYLMQIPDVNCNYYGSLIDKFSYITIAIDSHIATTING